MTFPIPRAGIIHGSRDGLELLTILLWGEARGEPDQGKLAVAEVVRNRVHRPAWWGKDWHGVMLKPWQFSCFNSGDPALNSLDAVREGKERALEVWAACFRAAAFVYHADPWLPEAGIARGASHYKRVDVQPKWSTGKQPVTVIGQHDFFALGPTG
jgi:spore germination cell wall hydrolase CwlJ-like protein